MLLLLLCLIIMLFVMEMFYDLGGVLELIVVFVMIIGVFGVVIGGILLCVLCLCMLLVCGVLFGVGVYGVGISWVYEFGGEEGLVVGLLMVFIGLFNLLVVFLVVYCL